MGVLENTIREELNLTAKRVMGVLDPIKVTLVNYPKDETEIIKAAYNPNDINSGERNISISRNIFIDKNDFMEFPEKKYFRLAPGKEVRLRHAFNITCEKLIKDNNGEILELECTYDPISRDMSKGNKVKGMIHWVDANNCIGFVAGDIGIKQAIKNAKETGIGLVGVKKSGKVKLKKK